MPNPTATADVSMKLRRFIVLTPAAGTAALRFHWTKDSRTIRAPAPRGKNR